jgi:hypothetical protein
MNIQQKMVAHADTPASHQALLKLLLAKGLINDSELAGYFTERQIAIDHLANLGSTLTLAAMIERGSMPDAKLQEMAQQMGIEDFASAKVKCIEALDYLIMEDGDREQAKKLLDQLGS